MTLLKNATGAPNPSFADQLGVNVEGSPFRAHPSSADNYSAITAAIATGYLLGVPVLFPTKGATYPISQVILNPNGVSLVGEDVTIDGSGIAPAVALSTQFAMKVQGNLTGSPLVATGALTAGSPTVAIPTATLTAGDILLVKSSTQVYMTGATATEMRQELRQVASIDSGSSLTLTEALRFSYSSGATTTATKAVMVNRPRIEGVGFLMGGEDAAHNGILFEYCYEPVVSRVTIDGCEDTAMRFAYCWGGTVEKTNIANCTSPGPPVGTTGYGISVVQASRDVHIGAKNRILNCRHAIAGGSCSVDVQVVDNDFEGNGINSGTTLDCHEPCFGWTFDYNRITGGLNAGIGIRGQGCKARWNRIRDMDSTGILVKTFDVNSDGLCDTEIIGNDIADTLSAGIRVEGELNVDGVTVESRVKRIRIEGNRIRNSRLNNIFVELADDYDIFDNDLDGLVEGNTPDGNNIRIYGTSTSLRCERGQIKRNRLRNHLVRPILAEFANDLLIEQDNVPSGTSLLTSCLKSFVFGRQSSFVVPSVAAAATLTLTHLVNGMTRVSGAGTIDTIDTANFGDGSEITLIFTSTATLSNAGNIVTPSTSFVANNTGGNDVVKLVLVIDTWYAAPAQVN